MAKIVDVVGNEFKVGCVASNGKYTVEVLRISNDGTTVWNIEGKFSKTYTSVGMQGFTILHYKELAPDRNNFMLCEGDMVLNRWDEKRIVRGLCLDTLLISDKDGFALGWTSSKDFTFFSRPTGRKSAEAIAAEAIALEQLIKDGEEAKRKLDEALAKARG